MAKLKIMHLILTIITSFMILSATGDAAVARPTPAIKAAYWPSWSKILPPSAIDTTLFTHVLYAFLSPNNVTYTFEVSDQEALLLRNFTTTLHQKTPPVKTLLSFGGAKDDRKFYARMASNAQTRKIFIKSAIGVAREFGFDGLDLDWEFPASTEEMDYLGSLFEEWRNAIQQEAQSTDRPPLLLTAAVYFAVEFSWSEVYRKYPVTSIKKNLDWINAMCYDYHGEWDPTATGAHAALYDPISNISTSYGLRSWIRAGLPPKKVVMGLPLYGRSWLLKDPNVHGIRAPAVGVGPYAGGVMTFNQVEVFNTENRATEVYDVETVSTYSYVGSTWVGYDDIESTTTKLRFAKALGLRGYFFWALSYDSEWKISKQASGVWGTEA